MPTDDDGDQAHDQDFDPAGDGEDHAHHAVDRQADWRAPIRIARAEKAQGHTEQDAEDVPINANRMSHHPTRLDTNVSLGCRLPMGALTITLKE